jgi:hypothetical protein
LKFTPATIPATSNKAASKLPSRQAANYQQKPCKFHQFFKTIIEQNCTKLNVIEQN